MSRCELSHDQWLRLNHVTDSLFLFSPFLPQQVTGHHRHPHLLDYKSFAYAFSLNIRMGRFKNIYSDVESVEQYRRGGYHPVRLQDVFNERYEVMGKIAYGSSSTVWRAKDKV